MFAQSRPTTRRLLTCGVAAASITAVLAIGATAPALAATARPMTARTSTDAPVIDGNPATITALNSHAGISGTADAGSKVNIYAHERGTTGYKLAGSATAASNGSFHFDHIANDDYRFYAQVGTTRSNTVLIQVAPSVAGTGVRTVKKGTDYTITGTYLPGGSVTLRFHKQGTASDDYSIVRTVKVNGMGAWSKTYLADIDYRFIPTGDANGVGTNNYLIQAR